MSDRIIKEIHRKNKRRNYWCLEGCGKRVVVNGLYYPSMKRIYECVVCKKKYVRKQVATK